MSKAQFDRHAAIGKATNLFRQRGFSACSMQQLVEATGIQPGSLYLAFGNKEGLFNAALEQYASDAQASIRQTLEPAESVGRGICEIFTALIDDSGKRNYCGCFLLKSQLELAITNKKIRQTVAAYLRQNEGIYVEYLRNDMSEEEAVQKAASIMVHIYGVQVYGHYQTDKAMLLNGIKAGLPWLPWRS